MFKLNEIEILGSLGEMCLFPGSGLPIILCRQRFQHMRSIILSFCIHALQIDREGKLAVLNQKDREGNSPLHTAIIGGNIDIIRRLVQEEIIDINSKANDEDAPIHEAARRGNLEAVKCLLEREDIRPDESTWRGMQQVEREREKRYF